MYYIAEDNLPADFHVMAVIGDDMGKNAVLPQNTRQCHIIRLYGPHPLSENSPFPYSCDSTYFPFREGF